MYYPVLSVEATQDLDTKEIIYKYVNSFEIHSSANITFYWGEISELKNPYKLFVPLLSYPYSRCGSISGFWAAAYNKVGKESSGVSFIEGALVYTASESNFNLTISRRFPEAIVYRMQEHLWQIVNESIKEKVHLY